MVQQQLESYASTNVLMYARQVLKRREYYFISRCKPQLQQFREDRYAGDSVAFPHTSHPGDRAFISLPSNY